MLVQRLKILTFAGVALIGASVAAQAADYTPPPPPPVYVQPPPPEPCCDSWYLRGYIGVGMTAGDNAEYIPNAANAGSNFGFDSTSYNDQTFIGGGIGYAWNNWLRIEGTAEYRSKARIYAFGHYTGSDGSFALDTYEANLKSWVLLANAYVDLGTWNCFTPFVGAGIGGAYNTLTNFTDINPSLAGFGTGADVSEWHLAWALYAGVSYEVTKNFSVDLTYRYLNYGSVTGTIECFGGCNADSYKFGNLHSNDIMLGFRWTCCDLPAPQPRYVYTPPPVYTEPPPLRSRG